MRLITYLQGPCHTGGAVLTRKKTAPAPLPGKGKVVKQVTGCQNPGKEEGIHLTENKERRMLPWIREKPLRLAVVGDIILDEYWDGSVARISPEAPVPIHLVKKCYWTAGGAANTARNIQLAGAQACLFGVWGEDEASRILGSMLAEDGIDTKHVLSLKDRPTIKKTRITAGNQQMLRVDWEKAQPISLDQQMSLQANLLGSLFDGVLISDYGKGALPEALLKEIFAWAKQLGIPAIVDPKGKNFHKYAGCTLITPNRKEACEALGLDTEESFSGEELGRRLQETFNLEDVLVTMGALGMVYVPANKDAKPIYKAPKAREVFDVSGAGDTVAAVIALGLTCQAGLEESVELANLAAGIVVEKWGTQPVRRAELEESVKREKGPPMLGSKKILSEDTLAEHMTRLQKEGRRFVFTNGCFDLLHAGHLSYLEKAKALGDFLVVAVNTDESVRGLKGPARPLVPLEQRMKLLSGLSCIDFVVSFDESTPQRLIERLLPQILVKGADYREEDIVGADVVKAHGGTVQTIELLPGISSSEIVRRILANCQL